MLMCSPNKKDWGKIYQRKCFSVLTALKDLSNATFLLQSNPLGTGVDSPSLFPNTSVQSPNLTSLSPGPGKGRRPAELQKFRPLEK